MDVRLGGDLLRVDLIVIFRSSGSSGHSDGLLVDVGLGSDLDIIFMGYIEREHRQGLAAFPHLGVIGERADCDWRGT